MIRSFISEKDNKMSFMNDKPEVPADVEKNLSTHEDEQERQMAEIQRNQAETKRAEAESLRQIAEEARRIAIQSLQMSKDNQGEMGEMSKKIDRLDSQMNQ
jgi:hypothetical protein